MKRTKVRTNPDDALRAVRAAFERARGSGNLQGANEAKTRLLLIDAVLEAMGWAKDEFCPETSTHVGDFTDYLLTANGEPWLVVEAKRAGTTFDIQAPTGASANSTVQHLARVFERAGRSFQDTVKQATRYCNDHAVAFGCVTNGLQWVFLRGLSQEREPWRAGSALVFRCPEEVVGRFDEFWPALARDAAGTPQLARALSQRTSTVPRHGERPIDTIGVYRPSPDAEVDSYVRAASSALLGDLYGDGTDEFLERCYVEPTTEGDFERSLRRLLEDSAMTVDGDSVREGDTKAFLDEIHRTHDHAVPGASARQPIVIVGHVGAGKSTFIRRSLAHLRSNSEAYFAVVDLDAEGAGGSFDARAEENRVAEQILTTLGHTATTMLKHHRRDDATKFADPFARSTLERLFDKELKNERDLAGALVTADPVVWSLKEYEALSRCKSDSVKHLLKYTNHLRHRVALGNGKRLPIVIVIDNVDVATDEYQRLIFGFARQISKDAIVVMCMREDTYGRGREPGGFLTSSPLQFVFHVRSPAFDRLLRARVSFARRCLGGHDHIPAQLRSVVSARDKLVDFLASIEGVLLAQNSEALQVIGAIAGHDMRDGLGLVRSLAIGDAVCRNRRQPSAAYALECLFAARNFTEETSRVHLVNLFDAEPSSTPTHGLRIRVLAYYAWARDTGASRALNERAETAIARFSMLGYSPASAERAIRDLVAQRALRSYDRGEASGDASGTLPARLTLAASGLVHLRSLWSLDAYRAAMALTTRWYAAEDLREFVSQAAEAAGASGLTIADIAASPALSTFNAYLKRCWAEEDASLAPSVRRTHEWAREVDARTTAIPQLDDPRPRPPDERSKGPGVGRRRTDRQLGLLGTDEPTRPLVQLRPLPSNFVHEGSTWLPRILWALEFAHRMGEPPRSSAEIARILNEHGEQSVVGNNVARAFREYKERRVHQTYWRVTGKRYVITDAGRAAIEAALTKIEYAGG